MGVVAMRGKKTETMELHPTEKRFLEYVRSMGHGTMEIKVQDGLPVMAEKVSIKVKFTENIDKN